jgi:hypothetical protein
MFERVSSIVPLYKYFSIFPKTCSGSENENNRFQMNQKLPESSSFILFCSFSRKLPNKSRWKNSEFWTNITLWTLYSLPFVTSVKSLNFPVLKSGSNLMQRYSYLVIFVKSPFKCGHRVSSFSVRNDLNNQKNFHDKFVSR